MKLGINLLLWTPFVEEKHYPLLADLRELGYDGVEIPIMSGDEAHYAQLGRELDRAGLARTTSTALGAEVNPVSSDPAIRRAAVEHLRGRIDCAAAMGAEVLCGPFHSAYKVFVGRGPTDDERRWCAEVMREAGEYAQERGLRLSLEALNRFECYFLTTMVEARDLVRSIDHPAVSAHYDTHHMHIEEVDVGAAIDCVEAELGHVHISENDRGTPGAGQVHWGATFEGLRRVGYDGWLTIEAFSRLDPEFAAAIHIWRDFFNDPKEVARDGLAFMRRSLA